MRKYYPSVFVFLALTFLTAAPLFADKKDSNVPVNQQSAPQTQSAPVFSSEPLFNASTEDAFKEMENVQQGLNKVFRETYRRMRNYQQTGKSFEPDADFIEEPNQYLLKIDLPGMQKDQINIETANGTLTVTGERKTERQYKNEKDGLYQFERNSGSFYRQVTLPPDADTAKVAAKYENGVLDVTIPRFKTPEQGKKKVAIQ